MGSLVSARDRVASAATRAVAATLRASIMSNSDYRSSCHSAGSAWTSVRRNRAVIYQYRTWCLRAVRVSLLAVLGTAGNAVLGTSALAQLPRDTTPVPKTYFGLHIHRALGSSEGTRPAAWPTVGFAEWRLWDAHVAWPDLEPQRGRWKFALLDSLVDMARDHHVGVLLTLGLTPAWASSRPTERSNYGAGEQAPPTSLADWQAYVRTVARRYKGRIQSYEVWNEPNMTGFFSGSLAQLVALDSVAYEEIKREDPTALIVSPSPAYGLRGAAWLDSFLAAGGARFLDVVGFHFYVTPEEPEVMLPIIDSVRTVLRRHGLLGRPIWNTETGWFIANHQSIVRAVGGPHAFRGRVLDDSTSAAYVARALVLGWCAGLSRFYWYSWDNYYMGLVDRDGRTIKSAAIAFASIRNLLTDARVRSCSRRADSTWVVALTAQHGGRSWLLWRDSGAGSKLVAISADWRVISHRSIMTRAAEPFLSQRDAHTLVGQVPQLLETSAVAEPHS